MKTFKYTWSKRDIPFCPDPENHVLVERADGLYWRKKRGSNKDAPLNRPLSTVADLNKIAAPAARRLLNSLIPYTRGMRMQWIHLKIGNAFRKALNMRQRFDYSEMKGMDLHIGYRLEDMLYSEINVTQQPHALTIDFSFNYAYIVMQGPLATHFYFEAVLVTGDPSIPGELDITSTESRLYPYSTHLDELCTLNLPYPASHGAAVTLSRNIGMSKGLPRPWMLLLKLNTLEGPELASHHKHYRMKVIEVGG